jgi:hypothetical protein
MPLHWRGRFGSGRGEVGDVAGIGARRIHQSIQLKRGVLEEVKEEERRHTRCLGRGTSSDEC